jgi:hypothetical protein
VATELLAPGISVRESRFGGVNLGCPVWGEGWAGREPWVLGGAGGIFTGYFSPFPVCAT